MRLNQSFLHFGHENCLVTEPPISGANLSSLLEEGFTLVREALVDMPVSKQSSEVLLVPEESEIVLAFSLALLMHAMVNCLYVPSFRAGSYLIQPGVG